jgi:hypothetical protein
MQKLKLYIVVPVILLPNYFSAENITNVLSFGTKNKCSELVSPKGKNMALNMADDERFGLINNFL